MFDDFVEHSAGYSTGGGQPYGHERAGNYSLAQVAGFEQDEEEDSLALQALSGGDEMELVNPVYASKLSSDGTPAIFSLSHVQVSLPAALLSLQVNSNTLAMAIYPLSLILIDLAQPAELINVDLPRPAPDARAGSPVIKDLFGDPTGKHLLITISTGDVFYLSTGNLSSSPPIARKPRPMRLRHTVSCVAWCSAPMVGTIASSTECLLGSTDGSVSTLSLPPNDDIFSKSAALARQFERDHTIVYTLPAKEPVTGLALRFWKDSPNSSEGTVTSRSKTAWVLMTTQERALEINVPLPSGNSGWSAIGKYGWAEHLGKASTEQWLSTAEDKLAGVNAGTALSTFWHSSSPTSKKTSLKATRQPSVLAWLAPSMISYIAVPATLTTPVLASGKTIPYTSLSFTESSSPRPQSILATEFHFVLLFQSRLIGVSRLNGKVVWEENLNLRQNEMPKGLASDPMNDTHWVYTDQALYEIVIKDEDRDVWRAKLDLGEFEDALRYSKSPRQEDMVKSRQADNLFDQKRFLQAAQIYAQCSRSFEFVALRFVDADETDALRIYLSERLNRMPKSASREFQTQRMMLATWLIEIYLSKCNNLEDIIAAEAATSDVDSLRMELMLMDEDLKNFLTTYQANLDARVIYDLIQSHGKTDVYLFFAELLNDHGIVVQHYVDNEMWSEAIKVLNKQTQLDLYYRHASVLLRHHTKETIECWLKQPSLEVKQLIPALLSVERSQESDVRLPVVRFLSRVVESGSTDGAIHNLLLTMLVRTDSTDEADLLRLLSKTQNNPTTGKPYYDLDYALRLCQRNNRFLSCITIYSRMGLYESSVDLALEKGDLELARLNADKPEEDLELRRKLWLKIAKHVIQDRKDIKSAMKFLEQTDLLKIEDILPFFPDFTVINEFKDEICNALENYSLHIESLRTDMDEATSSAENIRMDIENLRNRFITIDANERCSRCRSLLISRQFYAFPCQHVFHADCLIDLAKDTLPPSSLRRILYLQDELVRLAKPIKPSADASSKSRTLLSSSYAVLPKGDAIVSALDPSNLLLGGSRKLMAAGDKLRELIIPDVLASAVSAVGGGISGRNGTSSKGMVAQDSRDQMKVEKLKLEIDQFLATTCVLCESSVTTLDRPFVTDRDDDGSWDV